MARRANEMRLTARSMTEVAIRLAEPETVATEQVVSLSQAIRREVASLGDGIERALARASELETIKANSAIVASKEILMMRFPFIMARCPPSVRADCPDSANSST